MSSVVVVVSNSFECVFVHGLGNLGGFMLVMGQVRKSAMDWTRILAWGVRVWIENFLKFKDN